MVLHCDKWRAVSHQFLPLSSRPGVAALVPVLPLEEQISLGHLSGVKNTHQVLPLPPDSNSAAVGMDFLENTI